MSETTEGTRTMLTPQKQALLQKAIDRANDWSKATHAAKMTAPEKRQVEKAAEVIGYMVGMMVHAMGAVPKATE